MHALSSECLFGPPVEEPFGSISRTLLGLEHSLAQFSGAFDLLPLYSFFLP